MKISLTKIVLQMLLIIAFWLIYPPVAIVWIVLVLISNLFYGVLVPVCARAMLGLPDPPLPAWRRNITAAHLLLAGVAIIVLIVIVCFLQVLMYP